MSGGWALGYGSGVFGESIRAYGGTWDWGGRHLRSDRSGVGAWPRPSLHLEGSATATRSRHQ